MAIDSWARDISRRVLDPVGVVLARLGVSANALTTAGILLTALAAVLVANGWFLAGAWVLLVGSLSDTFDGPVARARGQSSLVGTFYDSVADRLADGMIFGAVIWAMRGDPPLFVAAVAALVGAQLTSYVRAKAESLGVTCTTGLVERAERAIALLIGLAFHPWLLAPVLWLLAAGSLFTVAQRVVHVVRKLDRLAVPG